MTRTLILVIGRHQQILETVLRLLNTQQGWQAVGALTDDDATEKFAARDFDLVLFGGGVEELSEKKLTEVFVKHRPHVRMVRHFGGGSGLLLNEVHEALGSTASA